MITIGIENVNTYPESLDTELGFRGHGGIIKDETGTIVGFYTAALPELTELEILEKYRRQGYAAEFIRTLFNENDGLDKITGISNVNSTPFFEKIGAKLHDSCIICSHTECANNPAFKGIAKTTKICDNYLDSLFTLTREDFMKKGA